MKTCNVCRAIKPVGQFSARKASPDGLNYTCRDCAARRAATWRAENPGAFKDWALKNKERLSAKQKIWAEENRARRAVYMAEWMRRNKAHVVEKNCQRRAQKIQATVAWANHDAMRELYLQAARMTEETGIRHEVDHIVPLQGESVRGLHWEGNLQVLTKTENIRKLNRLPKLECA